MENHVPPVFALTLSNMDFAEHILITSVMNFSQRDSTESKQSIAKLG